VFVDGAPGSLLTDNGRDVLAHPRVDRLQVNQAETIGRVKAE
jgi:hypothetical protein